MANNTEDITLKITAESGKALKTVKDIKTEIKRLEKQMESATIGSKKYNNSVKKLNTLKKQLNSTLGKTNKKIKEGKEGFDRMRVSTAGLRRTLGSLRNQLLVVAFVVGTLKKAFDIAAEAKNVARDAEEISSKFKAVFKSLSEDADEWADNFGDSVGRATQDVKDWMATLQDTFVPLGFAREKAADLSKSLVKLAVDVASFNNKADANVIRDFTSALVGNHETTRKYGILITESSIAQEALNQGINKTYADLTNLEKVQLRYNIILNSTVDAQGDAIRTAGSLANLEKRRAAEQKEMLEDLGERLIPTYKGYNQAMIDIIRTLDKWIKIPESEKLREEQVEFTALIGILQDVNSLQSTRNMAIDELQTKYSSYLGNLNLEMATTKELAAVLKIANEEFERKIRLMAAEELLVESLAKVNKEQQALFRVTKKLNELNEKGVENDHQAMFRQRGLEEAVERRTNKVRKLLAEHTKLRNYLLSEGLLPEDEPVAPAGGLIIEDKKLTAKELAKIQKKYYDSVKFFDEEYYWFRVKLINQQAEDYKKALGDEFNATVFIKEQMKKLDDEYIDHLKKNSEDYLNSVKATKNELFDYSQILGEAFASIWDVDSKGSEALAGVVTNFLSLMQKMLMAAIGVNLGLKNMFSPLGLASLIGALALITALKSQVNALVGNKAASGAFVKKSRSGSFYTVGEGDSDEVIIPTNRFNDFVRGNYKLPGGYGIDNIPGKYSSIASRPTMDGGLGNNDVMGILKNIAASNNEIKNKKTNFKFIDQRPLIGDLNQRDKRSLSTTVNEGNIILDRGKV